ncbi:MAG: radical SAM protein [ANME-2 cluster archaeon]|nr:MAG: radical SAM protein [ANME-2 cluster archaeon]
MIEMKKILLINPPIECLETNIPFPEAPLGIAYIAAVLQDNNFDVKILDAFGSGINNLEKKRDNHVRIGLQDDDIYQCIKEYQPDIVGITSMFTAHSKDVHSVAKIVKSVTTSILVVLGGAHPSSMYENVLSDKNVDLVVLGEGEFTFLDIVNSYSSNSFQPSEINGIAFRKDNKIVCTQKRELITNLDQLPFPARDILPMDSYLKIPKYHKDYFMRNPRTTLITSRGCPYHCVYCSIHNVWGRLWRSRSAENVVDEIEHLMKNYGVKEIGFVDDNISLDKKRMNRICDEIIRRKINIRWSTPNGIAIWTLDEHLLDKMKESGCYKLTFGIESGCSETQKFIGKNLDLKKTQRIIQHANRIGLWTRATFIIGFPYENIESINQTIEYAIKSDIDSANFYIATPYPNTPMQKMFEDLNPSKPDLDITKTIYSAGYNTLYFNKEELRELQEYAQLKFINRKLIKYLTTLRILYRLNSIENIIFSLKIIRIGFSYKLDKLFGFFRKT